MKKGSCVKKLVSLGLALCVPLMFGCILEEDDLDTLGQILSGLQFVEGSSIPQGSQSLIEELNMNEMIILGGSTPVEITSYGELTELYIRIQGENGYYILPITQYDLDEILGDYYFYTVYLDFTQNITSNALTLIIGGLLANGQYTSTVYVDLSVNLTVGTGALQFSLSWNNYDDIDFHITPPGGPEIYYGNPEVRNGRLDLDARDCSGHVRNENVYFTAPLQDGIYTIQIKEFSRCGGSSGASYSVTAYADGRHFTFSPNQQGRYVERNSNKVLIGTVEVRNGRVVR